MITALIVDDELAPREVLKDLLANFCPNVKLVGLAKNTFEAEVMIRELQPDLVFLDVEMPNRSGIQFLKSIEEINFDVIFTTAFDHYAVQAIKLAALDYLVKPIGIKELIQAVHRVKEPKIKKSIQNKQENDKKMAITHNGGIEFISINKILYCKADGSYTHFFIADLPMIMVSKTLKKFEAPLIAEGFYRCHKSFIVNLKAVTRLDKEGYLNLIDGTKIQVAKSKKEELVALIAGL